MTTTRKKKPSSVRPSKKVSSRAKKSKLLPAGEYKCTIDSLIGSKLTLNVNDLTLKDSIKLGLRLKIEKEPTLHPVGDFHGTIVGFGTPKESRVRDFVYFMSVEIITDHGKVFGTLGVFMSSLTFIRAMQPYMIGEEVKVRVRHEMYDNRKYTSVSWL